MTDVERRVLTEPYGVTWLRELCDKAGKGVLKNVDARCVRRVVDGLLDTITEAHGKIAVLVEALNECANDLGAELTSKYGQIQKYVSEKRRFDRDMEPVNTALKLLADLPTAAKALLEERDSLRARADKYFSQLKASMEQHEKTDAAREAAEAGVAELERKLATAKVSHYITSEAVGASVEISAIVSRQFTALKARIAALEKSQRTEGTVEVCERYVFHDCINNHGHLQWKYGAKACTFGSCPRNKRAEDAK